LGVADIGFQGVAAVGFCAFCDAGGGTDAADAHPDSRADGEADAPTDSGLPMGVAVIGFDGGDAADT
jgi:hypothetical protein